MKDYISFDSHRRYTLAEREDRMTGQCRLTRIEHHRGAIASYLSACEAGTEVAVEALGSWYWIIDEIEQAGLCPRLVHPRKAKMMMGQINKTDKLDVHGLNRLQRNGTLPTVWIPPGELRDLRELTRGRITLVRQTTRLKNYISSTLAKYGLHGSEFSDAFCQSARDELQQKFRALPTHTRWVANMRLEQLDFIKHQIKELEKQLNALVHVTPEMQLLMSMPGIAVILAATIMLEVGDISRFASAERLASYSGTTPRVHASGGHVRYGRLRPDVNRYLKWAFSEAANSTAVHYKRRPDRHMSKLYCKIRARKGHATAIGAVARHIAEAAYCVLSKGSNYKDPALKPKTEEVYAKFVMSPHSIGLAE